MVDASGRVRDNVDNRSRSKDSTKPNILADPGVVFIGLISYPLYLWHWPILVFLRIAKDGEPSDVSKNIAVLAAILLAWLTYQYIQKPIRSQMPVPSRRRTVLTSSGGGLAVALAGGVVIAMAGVPQRFPASLQTFLTYDYGAPYADACFLLPPQEASTWKYSACVEPQTATRAAGRDLG